jgi:hypothetical protein
MPHELPVSGRRCDQLHELEDQSFDLVVSILTMFAPKPHDVAKETVRVTPRRTDPSWATGFPVIAGRANSEDQRCLHAAAAGKLHQPDDVGIGATSSSDSGAGVSEGNNLPRDTHVQLPRAP